MPGEEARGAPAKVGASSFARQRDLLRSNPAWGAPVSWHQASTMAGSTHG